MSDEGYSRYQREEGEPEIGPALRRARTERGLSLEDVEQATKIRKRYISGLEEENYAELPAEIYLRGFLKTYADFLGLDGEEMVLRLKQLRPSRREQREGYAAGTESSTSSPAVNPGEPNRRRGRGRRSSIPVFVALAVIVVAVIGGGIYLVLGSGAFDTPPEANSPDNGGGGRENLADGAGHTTTSTTAATPTTAKKEKTESKTLQVRVSVVEDDSWLVVLSDGRAVYTRLTQPGFEREFEAGNSLTIRTGNAGAVKVEVNGQSYGRLGANGEVLTREFTLKGGA